MIILADCCWDPCILIWRSSWHLVNGSLESENLHAVVCVEDNIKSDRKDAITRVWDWWGNESYKFSRIWASIESRIDLKCGFSGIIYFWSFKFSARGIWWTLKKRAASFVPDERWGELILQNCHILQWIVRSRNVNLNLVLRIDWNCKCAGFDSRWLGARNKAAWWVLEQKFSGWKGWKNHEFKYNWKYHLCKSFLVYTVTNEWWSIVSLMSRLLDRAVCNIFWLKPNRKNHNSFIFTIPRYINIA